jgi:putative transposase
VILTYRYRLLPLKSQHRALERICAGQRELHNAALEERIDCYRKTGKTRTYIDQCKALTTCRREVPEMGALPVSLQRWTLKRLDDAFQGFFRRLKARKGKAGFPRFRGKGRGEERLEHGSSSDPGAFDCGCVMVAVHLDAGLQS